MTEFLKRVWLRKHTLDDSVAGREQTHQQNEPFSPIRYYHKLPNSPLSGSRRAFAVPACICLLVGDGVNSVRSPSRGTIDLVSLPRAQSDPHFVPLLFKCWCFLLSCDWAAVGLEEHQRKARGGSRRLGAFERGSDTLTDWITAASEGMRPALASDISPFSNTGVFTI